MNTEIITIGDEILIGQIVDTNSAWMSKHMNAASFPVTQITSVGDDADAIKKALKLALSRADVVLLTGGIGPTKDDITKQTLCEFFNTTLVFNQAVHDHLEEVLASFSTWKMNELNQQQAYVPKKAQIILNKKGTAPITWFNKAGKVVVSMPGVPEEMKWAMQAEIIPRLQEQFGNKTPIHHRHFLVYGIPESELAIKLSSWEKALPPNFRLAYLPDNGIVKLRLSAELPNGKRGENMLDRQAAKLQAILGRAIVAREDISIEELVGRLLRERDLTFSTAESCTGGNIARLITSVPGSSDYFRGAAVTYCDDTKADLLGVSINDIDKYGVVSLPIVEQMARGALLLLDSDIAVATSGIAGPGGGTEDRPVGTVCIAVATREGSLESSEFLFGSLRDKNVSRASLAALLMVKNVIEKSVVK